MDLKHDKLFDVLKPYCKRIRTNGKHLVCYPYNSKKVVTVSESPSDHNFYHKVYKDFLKGGVIIKELK